MTTQPSRNTSLAGLKVFIQSPVNKVLGQPKARLNNWLQKTSRHLESLLLRILVLSQLRGSRGYLVPTCTRPPLLNVTLSFRQHL